MLLRIVLIARCTRLRFAVKMSACLRALAIHTTPRDKKGCHNGYGTLIQFQRSDFFRISLNIEGLERATVAERGLLDSNGEPVRRIEVGEQVENVQNASINAL